MKKASNPPLPERPENPIIPPAPPKKSCAGCDLAKLNELANKLADELQKLRISVDSLLYAFKIYAQKLKDRGEII